MYMYKKTEKLSWKIKVRCPSSLAITTIIKDTNCTIQTTETSRLVEMYFLIKKKNEMFVVKMYNLIILLLIIVHFFINSSTLSSIF